MKEYADYTYYQEDYRGALSLDLFNFYVKKASSIITNNTNQEITDVIDEIKYSTCMIIDALEKGDKSIKDVSSISVDGVSKTYKSQNDVQEILNSEINQALNVIPIEYTRYL